MPQSWSAFKNREQMGSDHEKFLANRCRSSRMSMVRSGETHSLQPALASGSLNGRERGERFNVGFRSHEPQPIWRKSRVVRLRTACCRDIGETPQGLFRAKTVADAERTSYSPAGRPHRRSKPLQRAIPVTGPQQAGLSVASEWGEHYNQVCNLRLTILRSGIDSAQAAFPSRHVPYD
jgi:hypothetical protein